jgi:hypothetical protein
VLDECCSFSLAKPPKDFGDALRGGVVGWYDRGRRDDAGVQSHRVTRKNAKPMRSYGAIGDVAPVVELHHADSARPISEETDRGSE